jgi:hypothetical protein
MLGQVVNSQLNKWWMQNCVPLSNKSKIKQPFNMGIWANYFLATSGAAATLTGLIFIGLSINLQKILKITQSHLPSRALGSLLLLTNILIVSSLCLAPKQHMIYMGSEILCTGILVWLMNTWLDVISYKRVDKDFKMQYFKTLFFTQISILPFMMSGAVLISGSGDGIYYLLPGISLSFIKCLVDSWYLLVDVNRVEII